MGRAWRQCEGFLIFLDLRGYKTCWYFPRELLQQVVASHCAVVFCAGVFPRVQVLRRDDSIGAAHMGMIAVRCC